MDCLSPPIFDISKIDTWKILMGWHLKALGYKVYKAITKESDPNDSKHIEANAIALKALRASLHKEYLHVFSHYDSAFAVWSILTLPSYQRLSKRRGDLGETSPTNVASWSKGMTPLRYNRKLN